MSQIFHRSANTIARVSIFGAVFFVAGLLGLVRPGQPLALGHAGPRRARAADPVQPRAPRRRQRHRLPLLPHVGRGLGVRRHSADEDLHELPLADLREQPVPRAGARELPRPARSHRVDARPRPARLRLLRPQHPREQGRRLHDLPRPGRPHAADVAGAVAADGVVPRLPPQPGALRAAARSGVQHRLRAAGRISSSSAGGWSPSTRFRSSTSCSTCHR